jgi:hypothetical protein
MSVPAALLARLIDAEPPRVRCPWCVGFRPDPASAGQSTLMCPACAARLGAALDVAEASR